MSLGASLQQGRDHVGIYCTSGFDLADTCLLSVAVPLNVELLRTKLGQVPQRPRHCFRAEDAFLQAAQALRTLRSQHQDTVPRVKKDIVIITSSELGLHTCFKEDLDSFRVHLVNPSLIPYASRTRSGSASMEHVHLNSGQYGNSGQQNSLSRPGPWILDSSRCLGDDCSEHKSHSLTDIIAHSKSRSNVGIISNVSVKLHATGDATIQEIVGDLSYASLSPGQMVSVAICVKLEPLKRRFSSSSDDQRASPSCSSILDVISDLEMTLGNHLSELFELEVSYNHSFFPLNTRLSIRESCWLPRNVPPRRSGTCLEALMATQNGRVQKQLALCIAASRPPAQALREIENRFCMNALLSEGVSNFLDALKRRLKHRAALFADVSFMEYLEAFEFVEFLGTHRNTGEQYRRFTDETMHNTAADLQDTE